MAYCIECAMHAWFHCIDKLILTDDGYELTIVWCQWASHYAFNIYMRERARDRREHAFMLEKECERLEFLNFVPAAPATRA